MYTSSLSLDSTKKIYAKVDFSKPLATTNTNYTLHNGASILPAPKGVSKALRIDKDGPYALIHDVDIGPTNMPNCTLMIGIYLESIANDRGWVLGHHRYGHDRSILMHDSRFGGGIASSIGRIWQPWKRPKSPPTGEWLHITAVFRQRGESYVYLNGVRSDNKAIARNSNGFTDLWVGRSRWRGHWSDCWIKEVKVFNEALNDEEVSFQSKQFFKDIAKK